MFRNAFHSLLKSDGPQVQNVLSSVCGAHLLCCSNHCWVQIPSAARKFSQQLQWKEYFRDTSHNENSQICKTGLNFHCNVNKKSVWINGRYNPSWVGEEPRPMGEANGEDEAFGFVAILRDCAKNKDLCRGTNIHDDILRRGLLEKCVDALITMYAKCGALATARQLFDRHKSRDVFTWTALIAGCAQNGHGQDAFNYFEKMKSEGLSPDAVTYSCILKACASIRAADIGEKIHDEIAKEGLLGNNVVLGNALVNMYAKCGALAKARQVLEELPVRNVLSWNALITGYVEKGEVEQALNCIEWMQREGLFLNETTYSCALKACGSMGACNKGRLFHDEIVKQGLLKDNFVLGTALMDMYVKCGDLAKARGILEELPIRDVTSWTTIIAGYAEQGEAEQAWNCFQQMQGEGLFPDRVTFICMLKACGSMRAADKGERLHEAVVKQQMLGSDLVLGTALVNMYAKCGAIAKAQQVLEELPVRDVCAWTALVAGCAEHGKGAQALACFGRMQEEGLSPDEATFISVLKACGSIRAAEWGRGIHDMIMEKGFMVKGSRVVTALVDMYVKCGAFAKARQMVKELSIREVSAWTALIAGYVELGDGGQALRCLEEMRYEGIDPDAITYICLLKACCNAGDAEEGEKIHEEIVKQGVLKNNPMLGTALVVMFAKCGALAKAQQVLEEQQLRDISAWNALIASYVENAEGAQGLDCYAQMEQKGLSPDAVTFASLLKACGTLGAADKGEEVHDKIAEQGLLVSDTVLGTALIDMYAKCGALAKARQVLEEELHVRDVIAWNALIAGYVQQSKAAQALDCFERMQHDGLSPDTGTFSSVLTACSRLGLVEDAQLYFTDMNTKYGIEPDLDHYTCIIDLFGRAGHLDRAIEVIKRLSSATSAVWCALLGACRKWGDLEVARWAFERAIEVDKGDSAIYVLMAGIYGAAGLQEEARDIEAMRKENNA